jgi:hypothetical protein
MVCTNFIGKILFPKLTMTELLTQCNKSFVFIFTLLAITPNVEAQNGDSNTQQGLPVYDLTITQVSSIVSSIELGGRQSSHCR